MTNREIKFRTWDIFNGYFLLSRVEEYGKSPFVFYNLGVPYNLSKIFSNKARFVVQQFTGLLDKNNKEIYEGDILNISEYNPISEKFEESLEVVCWRYCGFVTLHLKNHDQDWCGGNGICDTNNLEIVGNIFENPELLK